MTDSAPQLIEELKHLSNACCKGNDYNAECNLAGRAALELELMASELSRVKAELASVKEAYKVE